MALLVLVCAGLRSGPDGVGRFIVAGDRFVDSAELPVPLRVYPGAGYDGQFFFRMALDPFRIEKTGLRISIDRLDWRWQRIGFPVLAHVLSLGQQGWTAWAMVGVNGLLLVGVIGLIGELAGFRGESMLLAMTLGGLWMSFGRSCAEITAVFFLLLCWYGYDRNRRLLAVLAGVAAVLAKETALVGVMAVALWEMIGVLRTRRLADGLKGIAYGIPAGVILLWKWVLHERAGVSGLAGSADFAFPFAGIVQSVVLNAHRYPIVDFALWAMGVIWIMCLAGFGLRVIGLHWGGERGGGDAAEWFGLQRLTGKWQGWPSVVEPINRGGEDPVVFFAAVTTMIWVIGLIFFSKDIWEDIWGYLRVTVDFQVSGVLLLGRSGVDIPGWFRWTWLGMGLIVYLWVCFRI